MYTMREDLTEIKINRILSQGVVLPKRLAKWELVITVVVWICILLCLAIGDISVVAKISGLVGVNLLFGVLTGLPVYNKYLDKDILIAYSPKYDQVMLIRPKSEERIRASMDI